MKRNILLLIVAILTATGFVLVARGSYFYATASGGGAYTANAVDFDGTVGLERDALLTGLADGEIGLMCFWVCPDTAGAGTLDIIYADGSDGVTVLISSSDIPTIQCQNASNVMLLDMRSSVAITRNSTVWSHIALSFDVSVSGIAGAKYKLYVNGVDRTTVNGVPATGTIDFATSDSSVGMAFPGGTASYDGGIAEFYFTTPAAYVDLATDITDFISGGVPVSLGSDGSTPTGTAAILYLKNAAASYTTNSGTGGNMVKKGAGNFADRATHP